MLAGGQGLTEEYVRGNAELLWAELQVDVREDVTRGRTRRGGEGRVFTANIGEAAPVGGRTRPADARDERVGGDVRANAKSMFAGFQADVREVVRGGGGGAAVPVFEETIAEGGRGCRRPDGGATHGGTAYSDLTAE
eukprot:Sspe_Gene.329::Locus_115_Transcript_12_13_Confidence_0.271_Length_521::g.329::m.329